MDLILAGLRARISHADHDPYLDILHAQLMQITPIRPTISSYCCCGECAVETAATQPVARSATLAEHQRVPLFCGAVLAAVPKYPARNGYGSTPAAQTPDLPTCTAGRSAPCTGQP